jgi:hypothetical protein
VSGAWLVPAIVGWLVLPAMHPTHTSTAELSEGAGGTVSVAFRLFADDIGETVGAEAGARPALAPIERYLSGRFGILDRAGAPIALQWAGVELVGDVLTVRARAVAADGLSGAKVTNRVLTERFADQVNIVRASYGRRAATLIFTRGDGPKALP